MTLENQIKRLERLVACIQRKDSNPQLLAQRLNLSLRQLQRQITILRKLGFPVEYSKGRDAYVMYKQGRMIICEFIPEEEVCNKLNKNGKLNHSNK